MTDCESILERLNDLLEGRLSAADREAVESHLRECPRCRGLAALIEDDLGRLAEEPPGGLAESILQRTSGATCESARGRLCGYVDGALDAVDRELVQLHLDGCGDCSALARALVRLAEDLPGLAGLEPDERFVADVLGRTSGRRRPAERWVARLAVGWAAMVQRPRFAWEASYVATFVLALLFATPVSPLAGVQRSALELAAAKPVAELREPVARLESHLTSGPSRAWQAARSQAAAAFAGAKEGAGRMRRGVGEKIRIGWGTVSERLASMLETDETEDDEQPVGSDDRNQGEGR